MSSTSYPSGEIHISLAAKYQNTVFFTIYHTFLDDAAA
jgi:hypothetical protein